MTRRILLAASAFLVSVAGFEHRAAAQRDMRVRPPAQVRCDRNRHHLTSFTGIVLRFDRGIDRTSLRIGTDWDTTEDVAIIHKGSEPSRWFLYHGNPFAQQDWSKITDASGRLRPKVRATAWVCSDGSNPVVDWDVPKE